MIEPQWIERVRAAMPELPADMQRRFVGQYGLGSYDATTLTASRAVATYYEAVVDALAGSAVAGRESLAALAKSAANWVMGELAAALNRDDLAPGDCPVAPAQLARLIERIHDGTISGKIARDVFAAMWAEPSAEAEAADRIIDARGLRQISDSGELDAIVAQVIEANPKSVEEFRAGREKAFNALVGQVMKATKGKANPQQVNELLRRRLG